jgi:hypothetical protein
MNSLRRTLAALALTTALSIGVLAGEMPTGGFTNSGPGCGEMPTGGCSVTQPADEYVDPLVEIWIELLSLF